jgi:hypothetical protein
MDHLATTNDVAAAFSATVPSIIGIPTGAMDTDLEMMDEDEFGEGEATRTRKERSANRFGYTLGDYMNSNYVRKFLSPAVREQTYVLSRDRQSTFRSAFRVPLSFVDHLTDMFITREWVAATQKCRSPEQLQTRTELFILCALEHLGNRRPHCQFETETNMCPSEHRKFFDLFVNKMYSISTDYIYFPKTMEELKILMKDYSMQHLPGAGGSIDVVHCKWANCPAGDANKCKGKESFVSVAFEVVTDHRRRVIGIAPIQYGARSDKHIVRFDPTVELIKTGWYKDVEWEYFTSQGELKRGKGVYFICDGGYLHWKTLICPFRTDDVSGRRGYFNGNLESIRKDVECTFGILKKRWRILDYGLPYRCMKKCEKIFHVCCMIHNMLLDLPEDEGFRRVQIRVGRGAPIGRDGIYLEGPESLATRFMGETCLARIKRQDKLEAVEWLKRRDALADHIEFCKSINI